MRVFVKTFLTNKKMKLKYSLLPNNAPGKDPSFFLSLHQSQVHDTQQHGIENVFHAYFGIEAS
jgi:hypothetical protein